MDIKITKIDKAEIQHGVETYSVFALTVDTGIPSSVDYDVASREIATRLPLVYLPEGLSAWDAILAIDSFKTEEEIPEKNTWDYVEKPGACEAAHFIFQHPDEFVIVGVLGISAPPGTPTWYATVLAVNKTRGVQWGF